MAENSESGFPLNCTARKKDIWDTLICSNVTVQLGKRKGEFMLTVGD